MAFSCPECGRTFTRQYDLKRHQATKHAYAEADDPADEDSHYSESQTDDPTDEDSQYSESESSSAETDSVSSSQQSESSLEDDSLDEDSDPSFWDRIVDQAIKMHADDIEAEGTDSQTLQQAYINMQPQIGKTARAIYEQYNLFPMEMKRDPIHRTIMKTKRHLEEAMDLPPREALSNAVKMRKQVFKEMLPSAYPRQPGDDI